MIENAIILAGGFGTRLRPLTFDIPKPLLPVGGRPFLETQFIRLKRAGIKQVILSIFHQAPAMKKALPKLRHFGLKIRLLKEARPLGTGGAIAFAWPDHSKPCLVLNGDVLSDFDIGSLAHFHSAQNAEASLWAIEVADTSAFGVMETGPSGEVARFVEKPRPGESESKKINAGLYALSPKVLGLVPAGKAVSVEREVFPSLLQRGMRVLAFKAKKAPYWNDIGTPAAYLRANLDVAEGRLRIPGLWPRPGMHLMIGKGSKIAPDAVVEGSLLLDGCKVGAGARLEASVLGRNCVIEKGVRLRAGAVLGKGTRLTEGSHA
jgi:mannose-1-phosphate guanylyltransferase